MSIPVYNRKEMRGKTMGLEGKIPYKILIVEDDPVIAGEVCSHVASSGGVQGSGHFFIFRLRQYEHCDGGKYGGG